MALGDADAIRVEGLAEVRKALRQAPPELAKGLRTAAKEAGEVVKEEATRIVPVRTGRLQASLRVVWSRDRVLVQAGRSSTRADRVVAYGGPIHFGWPNRAATYGRFKAGRTQGGPIRPQPFLYDARDRRRNDVERRFESLVSRWAADTARTL